VQSTTLRSAARKDEPGALPERQPPAWQNWEAENASRPPARPPPRTGGDVSPPQPARGSKLWWGRGSFRQFSETGETWRDTALKPRRRGLEAAGSGGQRLLVSGSSSRRFLASSCWLGVNFSWEKKPTKMNAGPRPSRMEGVQPATKIRQTAAGAPPVRHPFILVKARPTSGLPGARSLSV